jgi:hypothetical protein
MSYYNKYIKYKSKYISLKRKSRGGGGDEPKIPDEKPKIPDEKPKIPDEKPKIPDEKPKIPDEKPKVDLLDEEMSPYVVHPRPTRERLDLKIPPFRHYRDQSRSSLRPPLPPPNPMATSSSSRPPLPPPNPMATSSSSRPPLPPRRPMASSSSRPPLRRVPLGERSTDSHLPDRIPSEKIIDDPTAYDEFNDRTKTNLRRIWRKMFINSSFEMMDPFIFINDALQSLPFSTSPYLPYIFAFYLNKIYKNPKMRHLSFDDLMLRLFVIFMLCMKFTDDEVMGFKTEDWLIIWDEIRKKSRMTYNPLINVSILNAMEREILEMLNYDLNVTMGDLENLFKTYVLDLTDLYPSKK